MIVIDATNLILGRFCTFAAKQALLGEEVKVINAEKAVISGSRAKTLADFRRDRQMGTPAKGPFMPKIPDRYVRRVIRGMLPYKGAKGTAAFKNVLCYKGVPEEFKSIQPVDLSHLSAKKLPTLKFVTVEEALRYN